MTAVTALPASGEVLFDARDGGRSLRVSSHPDDDVYVLSIWREGVCVATFQLLRADVSGLIDSLVFDTRQRVTIRRATVADAAAIADVHVRSWQGAYIGVLPQDFLDGLDVARRVTGWERILETEGPRASTWVAELDATVIGLANVGPTRDADDDPESVGEVVSIYVLPEVFGGGYGRALMAAAVDALTTAGFRRAALWVLAGNARARRFYELAGWRVDGATKDEQIAGRPITEARYRRDLP